MEYLFRGIRKNSNQWLVGDLNYIDGGVYIFDRSDDGDLNSPDWYEVDSNTVCQFTGANAINGDKIFVGHIVTRGTIKEKYVIVWHDFSFKGKRLVDGKYCSISEWISISSIIGNIYDNPELLKG